MDVTCDRCGTEYEFEEALVSTRGTTVKCTQCGHLFKVYRLEAPAEADAAQNPWTVRRADGSIHRLSSLTDLTRLIEEGAFGRDDELSRTSKAWKRLGAVEELDVFFARAHAASSIRPRRMSVAAQLGQQKPAASPPDSPGPPPRAAESGLPSQPAGVPPVPVALATSAAASDAAPGSLAAAALAPAPPVAPPPALPSPEPGDSIADSRRLAPARSQPRQVTPREPREALPRPLAAPELREAAQAPGPSASRRPAPRLESEPARSRDPVSPAREALPDDYEPFTRRKVPIWLWVFVVSATILAFGTWLLWPQLDKRESEPSASAPDPAVQFLARADAALATHRVARFEEALTDYVKALAFHESDPHVLSSISRVYGVWAQELAFQTDALSRELGASQDVERRSMLIALTNEARELGEQAKRYAESAARKNPGNEEASIALADALRLTGNLVAARSELDRARATEHRASGETLRVAALLAIAEAKGDLHAGLPLALQAVAQDSELIRARLLLARCLFADADAEAARYQLAAVTTRDRGHPGVLAVEQAFAPSKPTPRAGDDAKVSAAPPAASPELEEPDEKGPSFDNLSHEAYIARGQKLLEAGQVTNAKRMFEQALFIRPNSAEGHAGLGFIALEKARPKLAVEHFIEAKKGGSAEALIGLGEAYRRLSRFRDALRAYTTYVNEHPEGPQISIARAQIERLNDDPGAGKK